jgi:MFS family permease
MVWSIGTVLTGYAHNFTELLLYRALVGLGEASYATISPSLISDAYDARSRNNALTVFYVAIPVGSALGYIVGGEISAVLGWRHAFIYAGLPGLVLALTLLPFAEPRRGESEVGSAAVTKPTLRECLGLFKNVQYQLVVWGYVAYTFAVGAFGFWGPTFLEKIHNMTTAGAARFFGLSLVVTGLLGTLTGGLLATRWQRRTPTGYAMMLTLSIATAAPLAIASFLMPTTLSTMACLVACMFFLFLSTGPVNTLIIETVPVNLRASAMALSIFMIHLFGDMWSPAIVGSAAEYMGNDLRKGVMLLPAALAVGAVLWFILSRRQLRGAHQARAADAAGALAETKEG